MVGAIGQVSLLLLLRLYIARLLAAAAVLGTALALWTHVILCRFLCVL